MNYDDKSANNSEQACELALSNFSYDEIIEKLKSENIIEKQACILALDNILSQEDANILISNLTGQDGRIREVCAFKINELIKQTPNYFQTNDAVQIFLKGITDVNPTVCRFIIEALEYIDDKQTLIDYLLNQIESLFSEISFDEKGVKKHILNKQIFKLYWSLEAFINILSVMTKITLEGNLKKIIEAGTNFEEYTIREKTHKLLCILKRIHNVDVYDEYLLKLQNDENFYVRFGER